MKQIITKLLSMMMLLSFHITLHASKPFTDEQVQAMSAKNVQNLKNDQIEILTPTQLSIVLPNLRVGSTDSSSTSHGLTTTRIVEPSQLLGIRESQIIGMTQAQLLSIPYSLYAKLFKITMPDVDLPTALTYALAHNK